MLWRRAGGQTVPKVHRTKETSVLRSADAEMYHSNSGAWSQGCPLGPCLHLHRQGTWCWGRGCRTQTGLWRPQPCMTRLTFPAPPSCFAFPGAQAHLSVTSPHHTSAKGAAECWTPEWSRAWSTAGRAAHTSLPCPDALLPVRHLWLPETTWQPALWHRDLCGRQWVWTLGSGMGSCVSPSNLRLSRK